MARRAAARASREPEREGLVARGHHAGEDIAAFGCPGRKGGRGRDAAGRGRKIAAPMLRFVLFLAGALVLSRILSTLPVVGGIFGHGLLGLWITALLLSFALTRLGTFALRRRRESAELRRLGAVDSPHNHGKLGSFLLAQGRHARALPHLQEAVRGEPEVAEWHYRLGCALLAAGEPRAAAEALWRAVGLEEEHAFGAAQLRLAEALLAAKHPEAAREALLTFERNHGPSPESAYRRAVAARALGRADEAAGALAELEALARQAPRYQRAEAERWRWRGRLARWTG